jgi:Kef-type K+ transport system membrane component KefB
MPTWLIKQGSVITSLTFLVWFAFAIIFPDDRLDLKEAIFVWMAIALALMACQAALRTLSRHRRTRTDAAAARQALDDS